MTFLLKIFNNVIELSSSDLYLAYKKQLRRTVSIIKKFVYVYIISCL